MPFRVRRENFRLALIQYGKQEILVTRRFSGESFSTSRSVSEPCDMLWLKSWGEFLAVANRWSTKRNTRCSTDLGMKAFCRRALHIKASAYYQAICCSIMGTTRELWTLISQQGQDINISRNYWCRLLDGCIIVAVIFCIKCLAQNPFALFPFAKEVHVPFWMRDL
jgi:hypothetical protein